MQCPLDLWPPAGTSPSPDSLNSLVVGNSQQLTIFYDGRVSVCDVTEDQARAILYMANKEMEASSEKEKGDVMNKSRKVALLPLFHQQQFQLTGLSMKSSLQRFLQKRKSRIQASSPYNHH